MIDHREDPHPHNTDYAKADKAKTKHPPIAIFLASHVWNVSWNLVEISIFLSKIIKSQRRKFDLLVVFLDHPLIFATIPMVNIKEGNTPK